MTVGAAASLKTILALIHEAEETLQTDVTSTRLLAEKAVLLCRAGTSRLPDLHTCRAKSLFLLARCDEKENRYNDVITRAQEAAQLFDQVGETEQSLAALNLVGAIYIIRGNYPVAEELFLHILDRAESGGYTKRIQYASRNLSAIYAYLGGYDKALAQMQKALALSDKLGDELESAILLSHIGTLHSMMGEELIALQYHFRSLSMLETNFPGQRGDIATCYANLASIMYCMGDYSQALDYNLQCLALREELELRQDIAQCLQNIGIIYADTGELPLAQEYLLKTLALAKDLGLQDSISQCLVNLANIELRLGNPVEALEYSRQCLEITDNNGDRRTQSYALLLLGRVCIFNNQYDEALAWLYKGLALCREIGYSKGEVLMLETLGSGLLQQGNDSQALSYVQEASVLAEKLGDKPFIISVYKTLADINVRIGDMAQAFENFTRYHDVEKEVFNETSERRLQTLKLWHRLEESRKEAEIYRLKSRQLEEQVDHQKKELAAKAMYLAQRSDALYRIKKELVQLVSAPLHTVHRQMQQVVRSIEDTLGDEQSWNVFEEQFKQVHQNFIEVLLERFPNLSATEVKVCALMKINLSSKEMCRVLNVAPRSVDTYRHRIRKKLGMDPEANLAAFFAGLH